MTTSPATLVVPCAGPPATVTPVCEPVIELDRSIGDAVSGGTETDLLATVGGSAALAAAAEESPRMLADRVASPGGSTRRGLDVLAEPEGLAPLLRNTLTADKVEDRDHALSEIYRMMRPGEPPTEEAVEALFQRLFYNEETYDLSLVCRLDTSPSPLD